MSVVDLTAVEDNCKEVPDHLVRLARLDLPSSPSSPSRVGRHVDAEGKLDGRVDLDRQVAGLLEPLELEGEDGRNLLDAELLDGVLCRSRG